MAKEVPLSKGRVAIIDDDDYERIAQYKWYYHERHNTGYAVRKYYSRDEKRQISQVMHHFILGAPKGTIVDHRDRNGLNNQKSNLRIATGSQNQANRTRTRKNTTGYKGVTKIGNKYYARIVFQQTLIALGSFDNPKDAATAYNAKALALYGEFACLNEIE